MSKLVKTSPEFCSKCKYCMAMGNTVVSNDIPTKNNIACNYIVAEGHSRIFKDGKKRIPNGHCDVYDFGEKTYNSRKWCSEGMAMNTVKARAKRKEHDVAKGKMI